MEIIAENGVGAESCGLVDGPEVPPGSEQLAASPPEIYVQLGCPACHMAEATVNASTLVGLNGKEVQLENGQTVRADEEYRRASILHPSVQVVSGYQPIMPGYEGLVNEDDLETLIAYIRSLAGQ
jgi:cytochrome c oxidase subunit 2